MKYVRLAVGIVLLLAGIVGLTVSLIGIYSIQQSVRPAALETVQVLDSLKEGVTMLRRGTTKIQGLVAETRGRTKDLQDTLGDIAVKLDRTKSASTPLSALDERIAARFQQAQGTVASLHSSLEGFQSALVLFNSLPRFGSPPPKAEPLDEGQELIRSLTEASDTLDQISHFLSSVLADRELTRKNLDALMAWVQQIQNRLTESENRIAAFRERLTGTEERIVLSRKMLPTWVEWGSTIAVVMLGCFGFSQIGLMVQAAILLNKCRAANLPQQPRAAAPVP